MTKSKAVEPEERIREFTERTGRKPFGTILKERRGALNQRDLDTKIRKTSSYVAQLESGRLRPPDRSTCVELARALGLPDGVIWQDAREERLHSFDPDLHRWHQEEVRAARKMVVHDNELRLLKTLRAMKREWQEEHAAGVPPYPWPERFAALLRLVGERSKEEVEPLGDPWKASHQNLTPTQTLEWLLDYLTSDSWPVRIRHRLLAALERTATDFRAMWELNEAQKRHPSGASDGPTIQPWMVTGGPPAMVGVEPEAGAPVENPMMQMMKMMELMMKGTPPAFPSGPSEAEVNDRIRQELVQEVRDEIRLEETARLRAEVERAVLAAVEDRLGSEQAAAVRDELTNGASP